MWSVNPSVLFWSTIALQIVLSSQDSFGSSPHDGYSSNQLIQDQHHQYSHEDYHYSGYDSVLPSRQGEEEGKELEPEKKKVANLELSPATSTNVWREAWESNLGQQKLLNNVVKELLNAFSRILGWMALDLAFYGSSNLIPTTP